MKDSSCMVVVGGSDRAVEEVDIAAHNRIQPESCWHFHLQYSY